MKQSKHLEHIQTKAPILFSAFLLGISLISIVLYLQGYRFIAYNELIAYGLSIVIQAFLCVYCFAKRPLSSPIANYFVLTLPILSLLYIGATIVVIQNATYRYLMPYYIISYILCMFVLVSHKQKRKVLKIVLGILYSALLIFLCKLSFLLMVWGNFAKVTITETVSSPSQRYTAIVIDSDQGALGGDTFVDVEYTEKEKNIVIGKLRKAQRLYSGDWGDYQYMSLAWQDENTLLIYNTPYDIVW